MAINSGFFNSVNGDRTYNADDMNHFFEGIVSDGVFYGYKNALAVEAGTDLNVRVLDGKAIVLDKYVENTAALDFTIEGGNSLPRYDAVVVNVNLQSRDGNIYIKQGTPASSPVPPTMYDNPNTKEIALAYVYVGANASSIVSANITDKRNDTSVCGYVKLTNLNARLETYRNNVVTSGASTDIVNVGIEEFDADGDTLLVFENGILMEETNEYLVEGTGSAARIHLANDVPSGQRFNFIVQHLNIQ